ncbi:hypothetical protein LCGC14_0900980 [marine sediment metagenome]|uniref:Uncharacterized protein n=1 Tax=marine sediment metagenome TaxID=412755 RepID=A0A0F9RFK5_9ZZZZ
MAEQASTDISLNTMSALVGTGSGANVDLRDACNAASINKFSWYRTRPIVLDVNKLCSLPTAPTTNRKLGDFRRYNHTALTPSLFWNPAMLMNYTGTGTFQFIIPCLPERMNLYELSNTDPMYWRTVYYTSSADRTNETNVYGSYTDTTNILSTEDGKGGFDQPPGHTNDELKSPTSSIQLFTDPAFDPLALNRPSDIVYMDTFIVNNGDNRLIRVGTAVSDSYLDITFTQVTAPYHSKTGPYVSGAPSGFTVVIPVVTTNSSSHLGIDQVYTNGDATYDTWWYLVGLSGSTWYRLGTVSAVATITGVGSTTTIQNGALVTAGASSNEHDTGTLASSAQWNTDEVGELNVTVASWAGFTSYALPGYPG